MAVQPRVYQLFHLRPSAAQSSKDALVSALWCRLFPGQLSGQNHRLDQIFARMSDQPELATLQLCPYYFDQVTYRLPTREQVKHRESCNLRPHCFDSWAGLRRERQRATEQHGEQEAGPSTGMYLSLLCQLRDLNTGKSTSTKQYIHMMYGHQC